MVGSATTWTSKPFRESDPEIWIGTLTVVAVPLARISFPPLTLTWPVAACTTVGTMKIALNSIRGIRNSILGFFVFYAPVFRSNNLRHDPLNIVILTHHLYLDRKNQFSFPGMTAKITAGQGKF